MPSASSNSLSPDEARRHALRDSYAVLDGSPEQAYDDIVLLASTLCNAQSAAIFMLDRGRQWSKAQIGVDYLRCPRAQALCDAAIANPMQMLVVDDVVKDPRFAATAIGIGQAPLRFFAGVPLLSADAYPLGVLCVMDVTTPQLNVQQRAGLKALARQTLHLFELRRYASESRRLLSEREAITQRLEQVRAELEKHHKASQQDGQLRAAMIDLAPLSR
ncbi:MAG: GAF domain-containing protein [Lysobacter sp.]